ncbi:long-chain acyl-CoA synthetase [Desulfuromusa kysingii]|uniref:Long-chain acyl-CoA synthetase n=1 Tax=Desulfuromusa kysingii TaxID=37625 RepID=A0A1H4D3W7_9BACT|nr:AMP-binding protein [Desulfuromusa kysingii]SEA67307.1 long-chain acyl-CoA synthetase [Desulfuromusa kysingii]
MQTIDQLIQLSCQKNTDKIALRYKYKGQWQPLTYNKLWSTVEKLAAGLQQLGIEEKAHVALLGVSSPRWVMSYLSVLRRGCVAIPIDKELKATELRHILNDSDAQAIFVGQPQFETLLDVIDDLPQLKKIILIDASLSEVIDHSDVSDVMDNLSKQWKDLVQTLNIAPELCKPVEEAAIEAHLVLTGQKEQHGKQHKSTNFLAETEISRNRLLKEERLYSYKDIFHDVPLPPATHIPKDRAVVLYTSGTTGRSKGAMLSHQNLVSNIQAACQRFNLDSSIKTLSFLPINHVFEQVCGVLVPLSLGGEVNFAESIKKLGDNLNEIKPTFLLGVPAVYRLLYGRIMKNIESKSSSRLLYKFPLTRKIVTAKIKQAVGINTTFVSGGAALDPAIAEGFHNLGLNLLQGYGITETSPVISAESPTKNKPGTVGEPLEDIEVKIDNPNAEGEGEILVKGPNVMLGYYKNAKATAEILSNGWYHTGDLGKIDEDNMLSICGRVKNLIVTPNGKNVYPEEVENHLLKSPYIAEIMVYGHKISATAEEVYAIIFPEEEALFALNKELESGPMGAAEIEALIRKEVLTYGKDLADYKRVKKFTLREDEFPKTTTRKIKRYIVEPEISTGGGIKPTSRP